MTTSERQSSIETAAPPRLDQKALEDPMGSGPLGAIWRRSLAGEISQDHALALARDSEVTASLSLPLVRALCLTLVRLGVQDWERAVRQHRLLQAALEPLPDSLDARAMRRESWLSWIEVVTRAVSDVPDGRLFRTAVEAGQCLLTGPLRDPATVPLGLHRLGILHLDPYAAGRNSADLPRQLVLWRQRLWDYYGDSLAGIPKEELTLPEPAAALETAARYLRQAADASSGLRRAWSLKALGESLEWGGVVGRPVDEQEVVRCYREAVGSFDPAINPVECASVMSALVRHGQAVPKAALATILSVSLAEYDRRLGRLATLSLATQLIGVLKDADTDRALTLASQRDPLLVGADEDLKVSSWRGHIGLLLRSLDSRLHQRDATVPLGRLVDRVRQEGRKRRWTNERMAEVLVALAAGSPEGDWEELGLELLEEAMRMSDALVQRYGGALPYLRAALSSGAAVNHVNGGDGERAARYYGAALQDFLELGLDGAAMDCLRRLADLGGRDDERTTIRLTALLAGLAVECETRLGEPAAEAIADMCRTLVRQTVAKGNINPTLMLLLFRIAKGLRFAAALEAGERYQWSRDDEGRVILERIAEAAKAARLAEAAPGAPSLADEPALTDAMFLAGYIRPGERHAGKGPAEVLDNLRQTYDAHVDRRLAARAASSMSLFPPPETIQAALDERTVLVNYLLGPSPQGMMGLYILVLTRDDIWMTYGAATDMPSGVAKLSHGGREVVVNLEGMAVQALLTEIVSPPWEGVVDASAAESLEHQADSYLGSLRDYLATQKAAGKDHLCFVPHGPLHYYPLHLMGSPEHPLANDWIVTYLPNLRLLGRPAAAPPGGSIRPMAAIGLGFADRRPHDQEPIPGAASEAEMVAGLFGVTPLLNEAATEAAVTAALQESRYVHIATHGEHCLSAPAFQRLYLSPEAATDGLMCAYEILALDLRGLEILTLSACETALGRFDASDNLRGLPASFLLAGTSTVIGTLWPVETDATGFFFTRFYQAITQGSGRLDAFATAQRDTRTSYPQHRDWGAFYMAGAWS